MIVSVAPGGVRKRRKRRFGSCVHDADIEHGITHRREGESIGGAVSPTKCMRDTNEPKATQARAVPNTGADSDSPIRPVPPVISVYSP